MKLGTSVFLYGKELMGGDGASLNWWPGNQGTADLKQRSEKYRCNSGAIDKSERRLLYKNTLLRVQVHSVGIMCFYMVSFGAIDAMACASSDCKSDPSG